MKWEYKTIKIESKGFSGGLFDQDTFERMMNELGQQGWELVNVFDTNQAYGASRYIIGIFKRPLEINEE